MKRRAFLRKSGIITSATALAGGNILASCNTPGEYRELTYHAIDKVEFGEAAFHWPRPVGKNARIGVHGQYHRAQFVQLFTQQGATGWGMIRGRYSEKEKEEMKERILGNQVNALFDPSAGILPGVEELFDIALHDLSGMILEMPVYEMLGGKGPMENLIYSGMIYFDELEPEENPAGIEQVMENCRWDEDYGYRQLKVKIGRSGRWYPHEEGLSMDIRIVRMIHDEFGDAIDILVDANDMYSLQDTKAFLKGVEGVPIYWMEEPFVENVEEGQALKEWMMKNGWEDTYYADGERDPDHNVCMQLARQRKLDVYLSDVLDFGFTPWRNLMPQLLEMGTLASPHAWGSLLKTHYAAHLAAGLGNVCTLEGVSCLSDEIDFGDYPIVDGKMKVSGEPGFGMKLL
jgi:L-alanine-DL-glutamate epimerase-like enolase superfamily enzyme